MTWQEAEAFLQSIVPDGNPQAAEEKLILNLPEVSLNHLIFAGNVNAKSVAIPLMPNFTLSHTEKCVVN